MSKLAATNKQIIETTNSIKPKPPKATKSTTANKIAVATAGAGVAVVGGYLAWFEARLMVHNPVLAAGIGGAIASGMGGSLLYKILNHEAGEKYLGVDLDAASKFLKKPAVLATLGAVTTLAAVEAPYISAAVGVAGLIGYVGTLMKDESKKAQPATP